MSYEKVTHLFFIHGNNEPVCCLYEICGISSLSIMFFIGIITKQFLSVQLAFLAVCQLRVLDDRTQVKKNKFQISKKEDDLNKVNFTDFLWGYRSVCWSLELMTIKVEVVKFFQIIISSLNFFLFQIKCSIFVFYFLFLFFCFV